MKCSILYSIMKKVLPIYLLLLICLLTGYTQAQSYHIDGDGISETVLHNYLSRAITMVYFLTPEKPEGRLDYPYHADDIRMIKNTGAKFIGRSIYRWGEEARLNDPEYWKKAAQLVTTMHQFDMDIIFQACIFEIITEEVNEVPIPAWVFKGFNLPVESRNFLYSSMINKQGKLVDHWHKGSSVPDVSQQETQLWFYFLAGSFINTGCEAIHLGQIELIGMNDKDRNAWSFVIAKIREYAKQKARRNWVLLDAHVPYGGMIKDGKSLLDFNSFPLRIKEVVEKPYDGILQLNYLDALYNKSKGGITPSGWKTPHLPYLVEFDNFGKSARPNVADTTSHFIWGWDEISWFTLQPESKRNDWLHYAYNWIKKNDPCGHLQMPGCRMISCPNESAGSYRANTKSPGCPIGYGQEETIKSLWKESKAGN